MKKCIIKEGSQEHVLYYNNEGTLCSEKDCEINNWHWCAEKKHRQHPTVCQKCKNKECPQKENP